MLTPSSTESTYSSSADHSDSETSKKSERRKKKISSDIPLVELTPNNIETVERLVDKLHENEQEQEKLAEKRKDLERKQARNKLKQKQKKWFNRDATAGTVAAAGITTLYAGVEYVRNFLPPGTANLIMPLFIIADIATAISAWKIALYDRKIRALKRNAPADITWTGSRNLLLRAIFETAWAAVGSAVVLGAIITSTFLAAAAAGAFAVFIAPVFMLVLGTRTLFNGISSTFNRIRASLTRAEAQKLEEGSKERHRLEKRANHYQHVSKIQAIAATTSAIGFIATTVVMLTHHFTFGFVGVIGGVALGGFMGYLFNGNSKYSSILKEKRANNDVEMQSINRKSDELELKQTNQSKKLIGFLPNLVEFAKSVAKFAFVPVKPTEENTSLPEKNSTDDILSQKRIQFAISDADTTKLKHPNRVAGMKIIKLEAAGDKTVNIPINAEDGTVLTKTRFGFYTQQVTEKANEQERRSSVKMGK